MALALGEDRHQHVGAGHFLAAGRLHVDDGALDDALEGSRGARILAIGDDQAVELFVDEILEVALERVDVDIAAGEDGDGFAIIGERQKQMLERGELVVALTGQVHRLVQGLFESARK